MSNALICHAAVTPGCGIGEPLTPPLPVFPVIIKLEQTTGMLERVCIGVFPGGILLLYISVHTMRLYARTYNSFLGTFHRLGLSLSYIPAPAPQYSDNLRCQRRRQRHSDEDEALVYRIRQYQLGPDTCSPPTRRTH